MFTTDNVGCNFQIILTKLSDPLTAHVCWPYFSHVANGQTCKNKTQACYICLIRLQFQLCRKESVTSTPNILTDPYHGAISHPPPCLWWNLLIKYLTLLPTFNSLCKEMLRSPLLIESLPQSYNSLMDQEVILLCP